MIRKHLMVLAVTLLSVISIGCAEMPIQNQPVREEAKYVANFNYTPDSKAAPGSAEVTFTIGHVNYKSNPKLLWFWFSFPQFENLDKAINDDLSELLIVKGFSVRGPFDSYDLIPYSDKKAIDLYLLPTMELFIMFKSEKTSEHCTGNIEINGKINLELREIITRELMWTKSIPFTNFEFPYSIHIPHYVKEQSYDLKPFIMDDVAKGIEKQYPNLMATISKLIDPEEMGIIKKQCQELKSKKGY